MVTGGTGTALLAGKGDEHLVMAVGATNPRKTFLQIAALEKGGHATLDHRSPEAVLGLKLLASFSGSTLANSQPMTASGMANLQNVRMCLFKANSRSEFVRCFAERCGDYSIMAP